MVPNVNHSRLDPERHHTHDSHSRRDCPQIHIMALTVSFSLRWHDTIARTQLPIEITHTEESMSES